jgi:glycosyltransferase involved in cell wall biosynthesis
MDWPPVEWFLGPCDVIHGTNFVVPPTSTAARVVTVHDLTPVKYPELCDPSSLVFRDLVDRAASHGAWIHTPSTFVAHEVIDTFDVDPSRVRAIPAGIPDLSPRAPVGAGWPGSPARLPDSIRRYILAIGTIEPRKGFPALVEAFDRIASQRPDIGLVIIGADGWGVEDLERAIASSPWPDRIIRPGYVADTDLLVWLRSAAVLAYPSRYEGFGFPPLMSMSLGVPVVATTAGAIPEVVGDGASLVPVDDVDALAGSLAAVLDDPDLAARLSAAGAERARFFTWERCGSEMVALYHAAAQAAYR